MEGKKKKKKKNVDLIYFTACEPTLEGKAELIRLANSVSCLFSWVNQCFPEFTLALFYAFKSIQ